MLILRNCARWLSVTTRLAPDSDCISFSPHLMCVAPLAITFSPLVDYYIFMYSSPTH
jgi:hypothetical protein